MKIKFEGRFFCKILILSLLWNSRVGGYAKSCAKSQVRFYEGEQVNISKRNTHKNCIV